MLVYHRESRNIQNFGENVQMWELDHKEGWAPKNWCFPNCHVKEDSWVPWTARRSNQSIVSEINPQLMLKLKLQYSGHLMWRADSLEKTLMLGKTEGKRRRGQQRMRWLSKPQEIVKVREGWYAVILGSQRVRHNRVTEQLQQHKCGYVGVWVCIPYIPKQFRSVSNNKKIYKRSLVIKFSVFSQC